MKKAKILRAGDAGGAAVTFPLNMPCRVLVVDDESFVRRINVETLMAAGYQVESATDGATAWDLLQTNSFDLMVTDNKMPKMSGLELLKNLQDAEMVLPVIMATGMQPRDELYHNTQLPIEAILLKPYSPDELLMKVRNVLLAKAGNPGRSTPSPTQWEPVLAADARPE
jgi:DNA-binding response OmpR family regulator